MMQWDYRKTALLLVLLGGCSSGEGVPEELDALDASYSCDDSAAQPEWTFRFAVSGLAAELGSVLFVETPERANPRGYAMSLDGRLTTERLDFSVHVPGTAVGDEPAAGAVPFSCADAATVNLVFCATHEGTTDEPCWACGDDSMGSPPGGVAGWVACN